MEIQLADNTLAYITRIKDGFGFTTEQTAEMLLTQMVELLEEADRYEESRRAENGSSS